jgi:hypothetical protein
MRLIALKPKWTFLKDTFLELADRINERTVNPGDGIMVTESPNGFIIALKRDPAPEPPVLGIVDEASTAGWHQLVVIDPTDCSKKYIWYWGTAPVTSQTAKAPTSRPISTSKGSSFIPVIKQ